jgi:hypothetical protein
MYREKFAQISLVSVIDNVKEWREKVTSFVIIDSEFVATSTVVDTYKSGGV